MKKFIFCSVILFCSLNSFGQEFEKTIDSLLDKYSILDRRLEAKEEGKNLDERGESVFDGELTLKNRAEWNEFFYCCNCCNVYDILEVRYFNTNRFLSSQEFIDSVARHFMINDYGSIYYLGKIHSLDNKTEDVLIMDASEVFHRGGGMSYAVSIVANNKGVCKCHITWNFGLANNFRENWLLNELNYLTNEPIEKISEKLPEITNVYQDFQVEVKPQYKGEQSTLDQLLTPVNTTGKKGIVDVFFIIDREGNIRNPFIEESLSPEADRIALMQLKKMKFEPGEKLGDPVTVICNLQFTFK